MIWSLIGRGIYWTLGAVQAVGEAVSAGRRLVRQARRGTLPNVDDTPPMPLTSRDVARQQSQIRSATRPKN